MGKARTNTKKKVTKAFARNGIKSMTELLVAVVGASNPEDLVRMAENIKACYKADVDPKLKDPSEIILAVCTAKGAARGRRYLARVCHPDKIRTTNVLVKDAAAELYNAIMCKTQKSLFNVSVTFVCRAKRNRLAMIDEMDKVVDETIQAAIRVCKDSDKVIKTALEADSDNEELREIEPKTEEQKKLDAKEMRRHAKEITKNTDDSAMADYAILEAARGFMVESENLQLMCVDEEGLDFDSPEVDPFAPEFFAENFEAAANSCDGSMPGSVAVPADLLKQPVDLKQFWQTACEFFNIPNDVPDCAPEEKKRFSTSRFSSYLLSLGFILHAMKPKCIAELLMINSAAIRNHPSLYKREFNGNRIVTSPWSGFKQFFVRMLTPEIANELIRGAYIAKTVNPNGRHIKFENVGKRAGRGRGPLTEEQRAERKRKMQKKKADKILEQINGGIAGAIENGASGDEIQASVASPAKSDKITGTKRGRTCPGAPKKKARTAPGFDSRKRSRECPGAPVKEREAKVRKVAEPIVFVV